MSALNPLNGPALAVVTGAGSGIGRALVLDLLARGYEVVAIDLDRGSIDPRSHRVALDVRNAAGMAAVAQQFAGRPAKLVFANAGVGGPACDVLASPDAAWQWVWDVNVMGALRTLRLWWPHLCAGHGHAVASLSAAALQSFPGAGPYRASKAALEGLYDERAGSGVSVHALCPGMVRTEIGRPERFADFNAAGAGLAGPPNAFAAHMARAMAVAETPDAFAQRVLDELTAGTVPFYWMTHPETRGWIDGRHRAVAAGRGPFVDFAG
jgi:2-keto-3-deoxy-L-fuconate dehydrogenase